MQMSKKDINHGLSLPVQKAPHACSLSLCLSKTELAYLTTRPETWLELNQHQHISCKLFKMVANMLDFDQYVSAVLQRTPVTVVCIKVQIQIA